MGTVSIGAVLMNPVLTNPAWKDTSRIIAPAKASPWRPAGPASEPAATRQL